MELGRLSHTTVQIGLGRGCCRIHRVSERECAHDEDVVAGIAFQAKHGLVRVDGKLVVAVATFRQHRRGIPLRKPAARRRDRSKNVIRIEVRRCIALRAIQLADLEAVVTLPTVQGGNGAVVVADEAVVAALAEHLKPAVDCGVVIDALDRS